MRDEVSVCYRLQSRKQNSGLQKINELGARRLSAVPQKKAWEKMTPSTVRLKQLAEAAHEKDQSPTNEWYNYPPLAFVHFQNAANPEAVLGLIARIEKLEAALQFYADPRTYEGGHNDDVGSTGIDIDYRGNTAREALKEET